jgi:ankyrin repeat protein
MNEQEVLNDQLKQAARLGDVSGLIQALDGGAQAFAGESAALGSAAQEGHAECVKLLMEVSDPKANESGALRWAALWGHAECVKLLIPVSDPLENDSLALRWAAAYGHGECVALLIEVSDPLVMNSDALRWAAKGGHADCVRLLLPASDPLAMDEDELDAAACARKEGRMEVAGMIEAFIEAGALSDSAQHAKMNPRVKSSL